MNSIDFYRVFFITGLTSLIVVYAKHWLLRMSSRVESTGADFIGFYPAARIAQNEGMGQICVPEVQQKTEQHEDGEDA